MTSRNLPLFGIALISIVGFVVVDPNAISPTFASSLEKPGTLRDAGKSGHHIVYQISSNDPAAMLHALSSADNAIKLYRSRGETVTIEIVANGAGVHMMRADTSPVAPTLEYMHATYPDLVLSACGTTKTIMEAKEGRSITFLEGVRIVPAGIVRVVELEEQGYAYVKP